MIVCGVDPGGKDTGVAVVDDNRTPRDALIWHTTIRRPDDRHPIEAVPRAYLLDVISVLLETVREHGVELIAVEGIVRPTGHAAGRKGHLINPAGLLATAQVVGAVTGRAWSVPVIRVAPGKNGSALPPGMYPDPIRPSGSGRDVRRHARSAFDVALEGRTAYRFDVATAGRN